METEINDTLYLIEEYDAGKWFWTSAESESAGFFHSSYEAMQNAIDYVQYFLDEKETEEEQALEDRTYGTYEEQVHRNWLKSR